MRTLRATRGAGAALTSPAFNAPTALDGTSVSIGGQAAFIDYISPGQINALIPSNVATGLQQITVTNAAGKSAPFNITINAVEAGLLAPPSFSINGVPIPPLSLPMEPMSCPWALSRA